MNSAYSLWLMPCAADMSVLGDVVDRLAPEFGQRSEERRVGKECRL